MFAEINQELKGLEEQLKAESDALHEMISAFNSRLNILKLGLPVWLSEYGGIAELFCCDEGEIKVIDDENDDLWHEYYSGWDLGYAKVEDGWSIAVRKVWYNYSLDEEGFLGTGNIKVQDSGRSLLKAPRGVRIGFIEHLPTLIEALLLLDQCHPESSTTC